jgi:hypothetical protein
MGLSLPKSGVLGLFTKALTVGKAIIPAASELLQTLTY